MAQVYRESRVVESGTRAETETDSAAAPGWTAAKVVYLLLGILETLLGLRFLLLLLGANRGNGFADFIYSTTHPFVSPFFGLFNYREQFGVARFEFETLIAMIVYMLVAWVIIKLIAIATQTNVDQ